MALSSDAGAAARPPSVLPVDDLPGPDGPDRRDTVRSNLIAFVLGGSMMAVGMLAFLYYDPGNLGRGDDVTTGSIIRLDAIPPGAPPVPPSAPGNPAGG